MKKKMVIVAALAFFAAFSAFADVGVYIKGAGGYDLLGYSGFTVKPTIGISPWKNNDSKFLENLSFEASADIKFGENVTVISPGVMAVYNWQIVPKFAFRYGLGVSVPIRMFGSDYDDYPYRADTTEIGFSGDFLVGMAFAITEKIIPTIDVELSFPIRIGARLGLMYKFGK